MVERVDVELVEAQWVKLSGSFRGWKLRGLMLNGWKLRGWMLSWWKLSE